MASSTNRESAGAFRPIPRRLGLRGLGLCRMRLRRLGKGTAPQTPLAERWNGHTWSVTHPVLPAGTDGGDLTGVSCASATSCTAVGFYAAGPRPGTPA